MKKMDNTGYLWHHGTGPFWLFSWEILQKMRGRVLFVASRYRAVLTICLGNNMKQIDKIFYL